MTDVLPSSEVDERVIAKAALDAAEEQLQSLCASHAGTFVSVERRSQLLVSALKDLLSRIKRTEEQVEIASSALENEEEGSGGSLSLAALSEKHRVRRRTLLQHSSLLELLELPSLMDACVRSSLYEEALSIAAFANTLERRHAEKNEVVMKVVDQVRSRQSDLRRHLLNCLKSHVTMPQCLEIVTALRRLNSIDLERRSDVSLDRIHSAMELSLQVDFLEARDAWLDTQGSTNNSSSSSLIRSEVSLRSSEQLLDTIERYRTRVFEIATQFNAIFRAQSNADQSQSSTSIISMWISRKVHAFLMLLSAQMNHMEDSASLRDALDASVFFAVSMGRLGADFSAQLSPLFENKMHDLARHSWREGVQQLSETLRLCREAGVASPLTSTSHNEPADVNINSVEDLPVDGPLAPPRRLMSFPPLARLINSFLLGMNELRRCLLPGIFLRLRKSLEEELADVATILVTNERAVMTPGLRGDAAELRQYATEMKQVLAKVVKPYVRGALESSLGNHAVATKHYSALEEAKEEKKIEPIEEAAEAEDASSAAEVEEESTASTAEGKDDDETPATTNDEPKEEDEAKAEGIGSTPSDDKTD